MNERSELVAFKATISGGELTVTKLLIPSDARRIITADKCRCDKAIVLDIKDSMGNARAESRSLLRFSNAITYRIGEEVRADEYNEDDDATYTHGIYFFLSVDDAWEFGRYFIRR